VTFIVVLVVVFAVLGIPSYVIGKRRGVEGAWAAFIPIAGPPMVLLWSIDRPGWMVIIGFVPIANIVFGIWLLFTVPVTHGRTAWWGLACMVPVLGYYAYAFTLPAGASARGALTRPGSV
jgi:hypothetical protein